MRCIAFEGSRRIAEGDLRDVALAAKPIIDKEGWAPVVIFDAETSQVVEVDFRGGLEDVARRLAEPPRGPGRPKLGVVAREVTLLPRQWDWLNSQPGGASVALRKLVDEAKKQNEAKNQIREDREAAYRFMRALAGNEPGFEEATRAVFAGNEAGFQSSTRLWPPDVREHAAKLASATWLPPQSASARA